MFRMPVSAAIVSVNRSDNVLRPVLIVLPAKCGPKS